VAPARRDCRLDAGQLRPRARDQRAGHFPRRRQRIALALCCSFSRHQRASCSYLTIGIL
jgi:hypothetical protein